VIRLTTFAADIRHAAEKYTSAARADKDLRQLCESVYLSILCNPWSSEYSVACSRSSAASLSR
jgi:hypothetical protein